jgi:hypothetical protein
MQDVRDGKRTTFFGLPVAPLKPLWCTEEGESFRRTAEKFGIRKGSVEVLQRHEVQGWEWPDLVRKVREEAWRRGCGWVIFDTVRAWCPQAERDPAQANAVMGVVREELTGPGLAVTFAHHDTKAGGAFGAGVAGTYGLVGAVDTLIELKRVSEDPDDPRRRMVTSRRFEPLDRTATLKDGHYGLVEQKDHYERERPDTPRRSWWRWLSRFRWSRRPAVPAADSPMAEPPTTTDEDTGEPEPVAATPSVPAAAPDSHGITAQDRLTKQFLREQEQHEPTRPSDRELARRAGVSQSTWLYRVRHATETYNRYMMSAQWKRRCAAVRQRCELRCESCGGAAVEHIHHVTYQRLGTELPEDLRGVCHDCHRQAHPWWGTGTTGTNGDGGDGGDGGEEIEPGG